MKHETTGFADRANRLPPDSSDGFPERMAYAIDRAGGVTRLASTTGSSQSVIRKWRLGRSEPTRRNLVKVAQSAGVSVQWLAIGTGPKLAESERATMTDADGFAPQTALEESVNAERYMDEIRVLVTWCVGNTASSEEITSDPILNRANEILRDIARKVSMPLPTRIRACLLGAIRLGDQGLGRLYRNLEPRLRHVMPASPADDDDIDIDGIAAEAGYEPSPILREGLRSAMRDHGLSAAGAIHLLRFISAEAGGGGPRVTPQT